MYISASYTSASSRYTTRPKGWVDVRLEMILMTVCVADVLSTTVSRGTGSGFNNWY